MQTANKADENYKKLAELFPNAVTETINENGEVVRAIDKDVLMQEISCTVVDGKEERYQFTWPDKKKSVLLANAPINKTLRPCREESVGRDGTPGGFDSENLYIEGDNLEVLKLLQETYLGKIKMIYIDPPYNTGNDFVYEDDFAQSTEEYLANSGQYDKEGNRLVQNTESNGRFHTDWLNMLYPRLRKAKNLLTTDGVIFISIDDNEAANLIKLCDDVFGETCFVADIAWQRTYAPRNDSKGISNEKEHIIVFSKSPGWVPNKLPRTAEMNAKYKSIDGDPVLWRADNPCAPGAATHQGMVYAIQHPFTGKMLYPSHGAHWRYQQNEMLRIMNGWCPYSLKNIDDTAERAAVCGISEDLIKKDVMAIVLTESLDQSQKRASEIYHKGKWPIYYFSSGGKGGIAKKTYLDEKNGKVVTNLWPCSEVGHTDEAKKEILALFDNKAPFDTPKPTRLLERILTISTGPDDYILDFFSGSASTAHAVMNINLTNRDSKRKYILVQIPEKCDNKDYKNICEIGKERIRRAGKLIQEERTAQLCTMRHEWDQSVYYEEHKAECDKIHGLPESYLLECCPELDTGFRVLKCDSSNMKDVYYTPDEVEQNLFENLAENIKEDRTPEDLLFQVMLDLGVTLSSKIEQVEIAGKRVFTVADGFLMACFDADVTEETIKAVAQQKPYYFVMRDSSMVSDSVATNFDQIFAAYSPDTVRKVL